jgi:hypothetical protein
MRRLFRSHLGVSRCPFDIIVPSTLYWVNIFMCRHSDANLGFQAAPALPSLLHNAPLAILRAHLVRFLIALHFLHLGLFQYVQVPANVVNEQIKFRVGSQ